MTSPQPNETHAAQRDAVASAVDDANRAARDFRTAMDERMSTRSTIDFAEMPSARYEAARAFVSGVAKTPDPHNTTHDVQPATSIVLSASKEMRDREQTYDAPGGERSMAKTVAAFNAIHGLDMTEVQGWQFMELLKIVRSAQGKFKLDNFVDGAAYAALAGEAASRT